jgi:hypothetical protein
MGVCLTSTRSVSKQPRICLVSPSHAAANPRLIKEANALQAAGYAVHVVAGWYYPPLDQYDWEIYSRASWDRTVVHYVTGPRILFGKLLRTLARRRIRSDSRPSVPYAIRAVHAASAMLARAAQRVPADLYIGHMLPGLYAAAKAARTHRAAYAFDAEDFHSEETEFVIRHPALATSIRTVEAALLPGARFVTAASPLIGRAYAEKYGIEEPTTLLNTFPLSEAPGAPPPNAPAAEHPRLYWFSQTLGPGRGLEPLIATLGRMTRVCALHLRGTPTPGYVDDLRRQASGAGFRGELHFHPLAEPEAMPRLAAGYDLGLSLEQMQPRNRDLCLTNKIFTYLLAGLPVGLTPTSAQRQLAAELGDAALLLDLANPVAASHVLDTYFAHPARQSTARAAAWQLGRSRYNWEYEQQALVGVVGSALKRVAPRPQEADLAPGSR